MTERLEVQRRYARRGFRLLGHDADTAAWAAQHLTQPAQSLAQLRAAIRVESLKQNLAIEAAWHEWCAANPDKESRVA